MKTIMTIFSLLAISWTANADCLSHLEKATGFFAYVADQANGLWRSHDPVYWHHPKDYIFIRNVLRAAQKNNLNDKYLLRSLDAFLNNQDIMENGIRYSYIEDLTPNVYASILRELDDRELLCPREEIPTSYYLDKQIADLMSSTYAGRHVRAKVNASEDLMLKLQREYMSNLPRESDALTMSGSIEEFLKQLKSSNTECRYLRQDLNPFDIEEVNF